MKVKESESRSVVSNPLWPHGLHSPWNSPGQNTWVGILQGIFPTQGLNPGLPHCRQVLYQNWMSPSFKVLSTLPGTQQMFTKHQLFLIINLALSECFPGPSQLQQPEHRAQLGIQPKCEINTLSWLSTKNNIYWAYLWTRQWTNGFHT